MDEDEAKHQTERADRADQHVAAQRRRSEGVGQPRVLVDRFVAEAPERGIPTQGVDGSAVVWTGPATGPGSSAGTCGQGRSIGFPAGSSSTASRSRCRLLAPVNNPEHLLTRVVVGRRV